MKLSAFRIFNFRSIVNSSWTPFSPDGITVLVGQNESGKSSILEALHLALAIEEPSNDDFRIDSPLPEVHVRLEVSDAEIPTHFKSASSLQKQALSEYLKSNNSKVEICFNWKISDEPGKKKPVPYLEIPRALGEKIQSIEASGVVEIEELKDEQHDGLVEESLLKEIKHDLSSVEEESLASKFWEALPSVVLFNEVTGRLPSQVDIDEKGNPAGAGHLAARNFLKVAGIDLPQLLKGDRRAREASLNKANATISEDFGRFWSQTIGRSSKIGIKCSLDHYDNDAGEKAGKPHLVFWISDGTTPLYPKQRSQGVRWFLSFYLQLKSSEKSENFRLFLLDEPGANLHSKAQGDVLKLINELHKQHSTVIYSTHSPQMIEHDKLYRVHAVQRDSDLDSSPTTIIDAHKLGTASTDTLSPVLSAMGADLSQHQVIKKKNNVLLEEMSGYYYIKSFWELTGQRKEAHFIAATGVNKIEVLANMFRGWGLDFIVAVDDDKQGRDVYKSLKKQLFGDSDDLANKKLVKLPNCTSIENIFSRGDFSKFVLSDESAGVPDGETNSELVKRTLRSKPVLAFNFALACGKGDIAFNSFDEGTKANISALVAAISERLD